MMNANVYWTMDRDLHVAVGLALDDAVAKHCAGNEAMGAAMNGAVYWGVHWGVHGAVDGAMYWGVHWAVRETRAPRKESLPIGLEIYLAAVA